MLRIQYMSFANRLQRVAALDSGNAESNAHILSLRKVLGLATLCEEGDMSERVKGLCGSSTAGGIDSLDFTHPCREPSLREHLSRVGVDV